MTMPPAAALPARTPREAGRHRVSAILAVATLALYILFGCIVAFNMHNRVDPAGAPLFYDFAAFYQAGVFANAGQAAVAYDDNAMIEAVKAAFPGTTVRLPWNYPPSFQLMLMPLAALPYVTAWLLWTVGLYGVYALLARRLVERDRLWLLLLAPAVAFNVLVGQNGVLSTLLIGGGTLILARRPLLGGALLGLMTYKPHFSLLVPLVLIAARDWRALGAAAASSAALALLALVVLGADPWLAFVHKSIQPLAVFSSSSSSPHKIPSVMVMVKSLGLDAASAWAWHWTVAAVSTIAALWVWRKTDDGCLRAAALAAATLLATPYLRIYDLTLLVLPLAALLRGGRLGLGGIAVIVATWMLPLVLLFAPAHFQVGPIAPAALLGLLVWRLARSLPASTAGTEGSSADERPRGLDWSPRAPRERGNS